MNFVVNGRRLLSWQGLLRVALTAWMAFMSLCWLGAAIAFMTMCYSRLVERIRRTGPVVSSNNKEVGLGSSASNSQFPKTGHPETINKSPEFEVMENFFSSHLRRKKYADPRTFCEDRSVKMKELNRILKIKLHWFFKSQ